MSITNCINDKYTLDISSLYEIPIKSISLLLDETPLMLAIEEKEYRILPILLRYENPYVVNKFGTTAVSNACMNGDLESLKILHEHGVDINKKMVDNNEKLE